MSCQSVNNTFSNVDRTWKVEEEYCVLLYFDGVGSACGCCSCWCDGGGKVEKQKEVTGQLASTLPPPPHISPRLSFDEPILRRPSSSLLEQQSTRKKTTSWQSTVRTSARSQRSAGSQGGRLRSTIPLRRPRDAHMRASSS